MEYLANKTNFIIYFSFFDTGTIGLKEIQNYWVFTFSHQRDLIIHNDTGLYVPELQIIRIWVMYIKLLWKKLKML